MLTWLHFSDLHICPPRNGWDRDPVMEKMLRALRDLQDRHGLRPDLIFFTGDGAFGSVPGPGGRIAEQLDLFGVFLDRLLGSFQPPLTKEQVFLVPGNHDVDRKVIYPESFYLDDVDLLEVEKLVQEGGRRFGLYMDRLAEYSSFLERSDLKHLLQDKERLIYGIVRDAASLRIGIGGFNTAWYSGRDGKRSGDRGRIWMAGRLQNGMLSPSLSGADLKVALLHHPGSWLRADEDPRFWHELRAEFDFVLHGHQHDLWVEDSHGSATVISASASYQHGEKGFNFVRIDPDSMNAEVWLRRWDDKGIGWVPWLINGKTDSNGVWKVPGRSKVTQRLPPSILAPADMDPDGFWTQATRPIRLLGETIHDQTAHDFLYYSGHLNKLAEIVNQFLLWTDRPMTRLLRKKAVEVAESLQKLPVRMEIEHRLTEETLKEIPNYNAKMLQIILLEFAERFTKPLADLVSKLEEQERADQGVLAQREKNTSADFARALRQMMGKNGVARFQGLLNLLRNHRRRLRQALSSPQDGVLPGDHPLAKVLDAFWGSFDLVLTEERFANQGATEIIAALLGHDEDISARKMLFVLEILDGIRPIIRGLEEVKEVFPAERDRKVAFRALTLHQSQGELRRAAIAHLDEDSAWRLLSMPQYPRNSANEISGRILERTSELNLHRILFDLQHDDFMRAVTRRGADQVIEIQKFLLLFQTSNILTEESYYRRYRQLLNSLVGSRDNTLTLDGDIREMYSALEAFSQSRSSGESPGPEAEALARLNDIAIGVLLRQPVYFFTIIHHSDLGVAERVMPHLTNLGLATQCIRNHSINPLLLAKIVKEYSNLFNSPRMKKNWALNPKAILSSGLWILNSMPSEDLKEVARSEVAAPAVKDEAGRILKRRK